MGIPPQKRPFIEDGLIDALGITLQSSKDCLRHPLTSNVRAHPMTFNLSTFPPYKTAVFAKADGDFATARRALMECLASGTEAGGASLISGLLFRLADVEALDGNLSQAHKLYQEALQADPGSPLALISYAESLTDVLLDKYAAAEVLEEARALLHSGLWQPSEDDVSLEGYEYLIEKIQSRLEEPGEH